MDQVHASAEAIPFRVCQLRGTARQLIRENVPQRAVSDLSAETVRARQLLAVITVHARTPSLRDEIQQSHQSETPA